MTSLSKIKSALLTATPSNEMGVAVNSLCANKKRPLGKINPWAWWVEITRGCNLRCDFCATRLFPRGEFRFMNEETFINLMKVVQETTPFGRVEFGQAGEPTLNPNILKFLRIAREIAPNVQLLAYTNGTQLVSKKITYKQLFEAGINFLFVDMYASKEIHTRLAMESGRQWWFQGQKPKDAPNIFAYQNDPKINAIQLSYNPYNWQKTKKSGRNMSTFFNNLDWAAAKSFGLSPIINAPSRRCDLPSKFPSVNYDGSFLFCCFDFMRLSVDRFGNINNGIDDFIKYWLGKYMQTTRAILNTKKRSSHEYCSMCEFTSIRCDIPYWKAGTELYWDGEKFKTVVAEGIKKIPTEYVQIKKRGFEL